MSTSQLSPARQARDRHWQWPRWQSGVRRAMDVLLSALLLGLLSVPLLAVAVLVKLTSRGPVIYRQQRIGLRGRPFTLYKFRTMRVDAEARSGPVWAVRNDPRCTRLGNFLRRFSIDELPQLFNVLCGEMSLIGPRPERPCFVETFSRQLPHYRQRHEVLPGITGWAQVNGWRGDTSLESRLEFDLDYVRNQSLLLDLRILLLTPLRVLVEGTPRAMADTPRRFGIPGALAAALVAATLLQAIHLLRAPTISADGIIFISIAQDLSENFSDTLHTQDQHPGYPVMLLGATRLVQTLGYDAEPQSWMVGGVAVSFVCGLLCVVCVWLLVRAVFDEQTAAIGALVFAVLPLPILNAADAHSDVPHLLFYLLAVVPALQGVTTGRLAFLAAAGAASAAAYWIRPEGLEVALVALACTAWQGWRLHWPWRKVGLACGVLAGTAFVLASPYVLLAGKVTSKQLPFAKLYPVQTHIEKVAATHRQATVAAPQSGIAAPSPPAQPAATKVETHSALADASRPHYSAGLVLKLVGKACSRFIESFCQGLKYIFVPFFFLGFVALRSRRREPAHVLFLSLLAALHVVVLLGVFILSGYIAHRHVLPIVALCMPLTALGVIYAGQGLAGRLHLSARRAAFATLALAAAVVMPYTTRSVNREFVPVIDATHWVEAHSAAGSGIVCNSPYVGFYGRLPTTILGPDAPTLEAALARGQAGVHYDYVVLHVNAHDYRAEWLSQIEARYRKLHEYADPVKFSRPRKVIVFEAIESHARRVGGQRS